MDSFYRAALLSIEGIGNQSAKALLAYFGDALSVWQASEGEVAASRILDTTAGHNLINARKTINVDALAEKWTKDGVKLCTFDSPSYPELLRNIYEPPQVLYYKGFLPQATLNLAIVGARKATAYGKNAAAMLAGDLAAAGCWVVSGAARGIDTAAHEGALKSGHTLAVLGSGVNVNYPPENAKLLKAIAEQGAVISEYPPDTKPIPGYFPARNRIINGISRGVLVVEAAEKSGALITADFALEEGRDVFAVPSSIFSELGRGTHRLIKQGAKLVESAADILEEYNISSIQDNKTKIVLDDDMAIAYNILNFENPVSLEELAIKTKFPVPKLTYLLLQMELQGLVVQHTGRRYVRNARRMDRD